MTEIINLDTVNKIFWVPDKVKGFFPKLKNIFWRKKKDKHVINNISFSIKKGEKVGYIGINGSGKSTTIKMLTGVYPTTSGKIKCLGLDPFENRLEYVKDIGVVFGSRELLDYNIAPKYSLDLYATIYNIPKKLAKQRVKRFSKRLKVDHLLDVPVRKLSLGEKVKFNIIASLLHKPKIVFLDEPTIGLDVVAREEMIKFLSEINKKEKTTIFLTTHNMDDIEELCERIIIIDSGEKIFDGPLSKVKKDFADWKRITLSFSQKRNNANFGKKIIKSSDNLLIIKCPNKELDKTISKIINAYEIIDLKIEEPDLKEIIKKIFQNKEVLKCT